VTREKRKTGRDRRLNCRPLPSEETEAERSVPDKEEKVPRRVHALRKSDVVPEGEPAKRRKYQRGAGEREVQRFRF